tara:strand:+ start:619 stop:852 length:234 start_codon:yes stop_codon:yes gene_type:complete
MMNELRMLIMGHRTFMCPKTGKCLDVRKSVAFEVSGSDWSKIYGPYDKSADVDGVSIEEFFQNQSADMGLELRVITG